MNVNIKYKCSQYYNCKAPHLQYLRQMILNLLLRYGKTLQCVSNTVSLRIFTKNMTSIKNNIVNVPEEFSSADIP